MDWYTDDRGIPSAFKFRIKSRDFWRETNATNLGHNDILAPEAVIRVRVVEIHIRDRNGGVRADVLHSRHF
jgi:hypothetical protein